MISLKKGVRFIGITIFLVLLWQVNWSQMLATFYTLKPFYLAWYALSFLLYFFVRVLRLQVILKKQSFAVSLRHSFIVSAETSFIANFTPGRAGELLKMAYLQEHGVPKMQGFVTVLIERLYDLALLSVLAVVGVGYFLFYYYPAFMFPAVLVFLLVGAFAWASMLFARHVVWQRLKKYLPTMVLENLTVLKKVFPSAWSVCWCPTLVYSLLSLTLLFFHMAMLVIAFDFHLSMAFIVFSYAVIAIATLLPISIAGLGVREGLYVVLFGLLGVSQESALLYALWDGVFFTYLASGLIFLFARSVENLP